MYISGLVSWSPTGRVHDSLPEGWPVIFWVLIVSDKQPSSTMHKHIDMGVLAFHILTVQKGKDFVGGGGEVFSNISDCIPGISLEGSTCKIRIECYRNTTEVCF